MAWRQLAAPLLPAEAARRARAAGPRGCGACVQQLLSAATVIGHLFALGLVFGCTRVATAAAALAVLVLAGTVLQWWRRSSALGRGGSSPGAAVLEAARQHVSPTWLAVALLLEGDGTRLLAGVLLVGCPQVPWWEVAECLAPQLARRGIEGKCTSACFWGPVALLTLTLLGGGGQGPGLSALEGGAQGEGGDAEQGGQDALRRSLSGFQRCLRCLPNWLPPTRRELEEWRKRFSLDEELLGAYACSVRAGKRAHQGRLYISFGRWSGVGHICFHGSAFLRSAVVFCISVDELEEVRYCQPREEAVLILKQPISLRPARSRRAAALVAGKQQRDAVSSIELQPGTRGFAALSALFAGPSGEDDDEEESSSEEDEAAMQPIDSSHVPTSTSEEGAFQKILEAHIPEVQLDSIIEELLSEEWPPDGLLCEYLSALGSTEIVVLPSVGGSDLSAKVTLREMTFVMPVPPKPMCPRSTKVTMSVRISVAAAAAGRRALSVETSSVSHDVPFGSNFVVQECVDLVPDDRGEGLSLTKSCRLVFHKSCGFLKSRIHAATMSAQATAADCFLAVLRQRASDGASAEGYTTCTGRVWELQRRATPFHSWRAPFLPHDGEKRWRWVDDSYHKHHWNSASRRDLAAAAPEPPLRAGECWRPLGDWKVSLADGSHGGVDQDGWQYALHFFRRDHHHWSANQMGRHVRRRLWTCSFQEAPAEARPA